MKKLVLLLLLALSVIAVQAQTIRRLPLSTTNHTNLDTVTNTGVRSQGVQVVNFDNLSIQANLTKISGTVGGNVILLASQDSVNFEQIPSLRSTGVIGLDTLKATNVTSQSHSFIIPKNYWNYYLLQYTGTGTMACKFQTYVSQKPVFFNLR